MWEFIGTPTLEGADHLPVEIVLAHRGREATFTIPWGVLRGTAGWLPKDLLRAMTSGEANYLALSSREHARLGSLVKRGRAGPRTAGRAIAPLLADLGWFPRLARWIAIGAEPHVSLKIVDPRSGGSGHGSLELLEIHP